MIKKISLAIILCLSGGALLGADWRSEVMGYLGANKDYEGAATFLRQAIAGVEGDDRPSALCLLAFLERKAGRPDAEAARMTEYFETYHDVDPILLILDEAVRRDFIGFWARWKSVYPLASGLAILEPVGEADPAPPSRLLIGLDLANGAFYKISEGGNVLEGGLWQAGFHILRLPLSGRYEDTGTLVYDLDLKSGALIIRKRITVEVSVRPVGPAPVLTGPPAGAKPEAAQANPLSGEISLYIDDTLILKSKKIPAKPAPYKFKLPGPSAQGTKPYMAPRKDIPQFNGVSILDALGLLYKTIKDIGKKKKEAAMPPPTYRKAAQVSYSFSKTGPDGQPLPFKALVSVISSGGSVVSR